VNPFDPLGKVRALLKGAKESGETRGAFTEGEGRKRGTVEGVAGRGKEKVGGEAEAEEGLRSYERKGN
jgi:hypothetical protein